MDIINAAEKLRNRGHLATVVGKRHQDSEKHPEHLAWMLDGIIIGYIQHEKAHRWLGFVQGMLVAQGKFSVYELKIVNKGG